MEGVVLDFSIRQGVCNLCMYLVYFFRGRVWCSFVYKVDVQCIIEVLLQMIDRVNGEYFLGDDVGVISKCVCFFYVVGCEQNGLVGDKGI